MGKGTRYGSNQTYTVTTAGGLIIGEDSHRRWIVFSNPTANPINVAFGRAAVQSQDLVVPALTTIRPFYYAEFGPLITGAIYAVTITTNGTLAVIQGFDSSDDPPLQALLESFLAQMS